MRFRQLGRDVTEIRRRSCLPSGAILHLPVLNTMKFFKFEGGVGSCPKKNGLTRKRKALPLPRTSKPESRRINRASKNPAHRNGKPMSDDYGTVIPEGLSFQTMTSGDINDTCESKPHVNVVREKLRAAANNSELPEAERQAAREVLRLSFNERALI
jgi:hypothetical protein